MKNMMQPSSRIPLEARTDETQVWMLTSRRERRRPWPLITAVAAHGALLLLHFPAITEIEAEPETKSYVRLVQPPRFQPPEPEVLEIRKPRAKKVFVPDPTPEDPEPLLQEMEIEPDLRLPEVDDLFDLPSGPPPVPRDSGPIAVGGDVEAPVVIERIAPKYTELARKTRTEGVVVLKAVIDREGRVVDIKLLKPLPFGLDQAAIEAASKWRFTPATLHGKPVAVYMNLTVNFQLN